MSRATGIRSGKSHVATAAMLIPTLTAARLRSRTRACAVERPMLPISTNTTVYRRTRSYSNVARAGEPDHEPDASVQTVNAISAAATRATPRLIPVIAVRDNIALALKITSTPTAATLTASGKNPPDARATPAGARTAQGGRRSRRSAGFG